MAQITNVGFMARLRSNASHHVIRYRAGKVRESGRGLVFWFRPDLAIIAELPMDDRETTVFVKGRSGDFQALNLQGVIGWRIADPERAAERIDFTIALRSGTHEGQPLEKIEARITGLVSQAALDYLAATDVRSLLDAGIDPLRDRLDKALAVSPDLQELGIQVVSVRMQNLAPSSELERALQTPTFEALQQKADQAMFERRALAVDKERAIAENELANRIELARREKELIAEEAGNARDRAKGIAEASRVEADAEALRIRTVESARAEAEQAHMAVFRDLPPQVLLGLAAREFAGKLETIEHLNVTPDLLANLLRELGQARPALVEAR